MYRMVQRKWPILFFIPNLCFTIFFHIFQVVQTAGLRDSFDTNTDPTGRYTTQKRIKINKVPQNQFFWYSGNAGEILAGTMSTTVAFVGICHTSWLPKFGHQTLNCPSIRYIVPAKISPALPLCQNWFCGKVHLDDFYPLLRSIALSWIHTGDPY